MPDQLAIVPTETLQPAAAAEFVAANVNRLPAEFTLYVDFARLFMGESRPANESRIMGAIMEILAWNYAIDMRKDDLQMRLVMKCARFQNAGEAIEPGRSIGGLLG
jgi:hypothetical protein